MAFPDGVELRPQDVLAAAQAAMDWPPGNRMNWYIGEENDDGDISTAVNRIRLGQKVHG